MTECIGESFMSERKSTGNTASVKRSLHRRVN